MKIKVGDKLFCYKTGYMDDDNEVFCYANKVYEVVRVSGNTLWFDSEISNSHQWVIDSEFFEYFSLERVSVWHGSKLKFNLFGV